mmetsp:Transcript_13397/g.27225  ORF Transcript_13397/g.27225 Transcript_13397/m.27225 type:complete len:206 (-) Transcript_13397:138-755(-)
MPSPVQCSPFVVGKCIKSGRYCANNEFCVKSAPKPPLAKITGPYAFSSTPPFSYTKPMHVAPFVSNVWARAFVTIRARSVFSATFSSIWIKAYVIVIPGKRSLPRCVRGAEWPPKRARRERSRSNFSTSQSTSAPLFPQSTFANSGRLAPPLSVSDVNNSTESSTPLLFCVFVAAPLMPLVALVELPPQKDDLSTSSTLPPHSIT